MTWNRSERELKQLLNQANQWHPNIKLDYTISGHLPFLDVLLTNRAGYLSTSVYHRPTTEPYVVPYVSDHHPHVFRNIIRTFLQRAIRYSSSYEIFEDERRSIKLMLLYNGYVPMSSIFILDGPTISLPFKSCLDIRRHSSMNNSNDSLLRQQRRRHSYRTSTMKSNFYPYIVKSMVSSRLDNHKWRRVQQSQISTMSKPMSMRRQQQQQEQQ